MRWGMTYSTMTVIFPLDTTFFRHHDNAWMLSSPSSTATRIFRDIPKKLSSNSTRLDSCCYINILTCFSLSGCDLYLHVYPVFRSACFFVGDAVFDLKSNSNDNRNIHTCTINRWQANNVKDAWTDEGSELHLLFITTKIMCD